MQKYLLAGISAIALIGAGAVNAADQGAQGQAGAKEGYASEMEKKGYDTEPGKRGVEMETTPQSQDPTVREGIGPQGRVMMPSDTPGGMFSERYGSYGTTYGEGQQAFEGDIMRNGQRFTDMSAEELLGATVADNAGNQIGEVEDLLVGEDGNVSKVVVDLEDGDTIAMDMGHLQLEQGSGGNAMVTVLNAEQLQGLPRYKRDESGWSMDKDFDTPTRSPQ